MFDENFLVTIATIRATAIHQLSEAVVLILFFKISELFEELAVSRSRRSISTLLEIRPDATNLKTANGIEIVSPARVKLGDTIIIKLGEKVPLDSEIIDGNSQVDTSALTGESVPYTVNMGETVLAGMINQTGVLTITVTKLFGEPSIALMLNLVENVVGTHLNLYLLAILKINPKLIIILTIVILNHSLDRTVRINLGKIKFLTASK